MSKDYDIVKELRKAEEVGVFDSKTMNPPIDYEFAGKNNFEDDYQTEGFFKDETNHLVPGPSVLDLIFASIPLPFLFKNDQGFYTFVNDAACRLLGKSREEIIGNSDFELFPKNEAQRYTLVDKKLMATGESEAQLTKFTCKNEKRWVKIFKTPVKRDGIIIGVLFCLHDVQEEKNLITVLEDRTAEYGSLFDHINNGFAYNEIVTDEKGNPIDYVFLDVNSSFEKMTGLKKKDVLGKKATEVLKGIENDFSDWIGYYGRVALHNEKIKFENYSEPLDTWYHVHSYSLHKGFFITIFEDITERKKVEEALRENEEKLNTLFSQSLDGFFFMMLDDPIEWNESVDKEKTLDYVFHHQRMTKVNQAMLDQYKAKEEDFIGLTAYDLFKHDLEHGQYIWRGLFDRGRWHVETNERRMDGSEMWVMGDYICMYDSKGRITGHFGIQTDITQQKKTKIELQEKINALERYKKVTVDRELKMIELKKENDKLKKLISKSNH